MKKLILAVIMCLCMAATAVAYHDIGYRQADNDYHYTSSYTYYGDNAKCDTYKYYCDQYDACYDYNMYCRSSSYNYHKDWRTYDDYQPIEWEYDCTGYNCHHYYNRPAHEFDGYTYSNFAGTGYTRQRYPSDFGGLRAHYLGPDWQLDHRTIALQGHRVGSDGNVIASHNDAFVKPWERRGYHGRVWAW